MPGSHPATPPLQKSPFRKEGALFSPLSSYRIVYPPALFYMGEWGDQFLYHNNKRNKMTRKVYILSNGGHDYTDAARFGELVFLNIPSHLKWDIAALYDELSEKLEDAKVDDLLVVSHLTSHCCVATALLIEWFGRVNFLIYRKDKYEEKKLVVNDSVVGYIND